MEINPEFLSIVLAFGGIVLGVTVYSAIMLYARLRKMKAMEQKPTEVGFVVDTFHGLVSQLKQKEAELEKLRAIAEERAGRMEDYNEHILRSVPSGVVSLDTDWRVVLMNPSAEGILATKAAKVAGQDGRELLRPILECMNGNGPAADMADAGPGIGLAERGSGRCHYVNPLGRRLWLDFNLTPLRDGAGRTIGRLLVLTDRTEMHALEDQAALHQRLSSLGEMAAGIAHELRNPMGVISGYTRLLEKKADEISRPTVEAINREVGIMDRIITDFLSFARPRPLDLAMVDLHALALECAANAQASPEGASIHLRVPSGLTARLDEIMIRQAITNLLANALDATPAGGTVTLGAGQKDGSLWIEVADTGHGMEEGIVNKVFNPFFTTKKAGTGLGLAIVHRIATAHGGTALIESSPKGTTVRLTLPVPARA